MRIPRVRRWLGQGLVGAAVLALVAAVTLPASAQSKKDDWPPEHEAAIRRAHVWLEPKVPVESADLAANPGDEFKRDQVVQCRFEPEPLSGNTPKFDCRRPDGDVIRVKYGARNPEVFAEVLATRLLSALGFPADHMYVVAGVQCAGCPPEPFTALQCLGTRGATKESCIGKIDEAQSRLFEPAVIERQFEGHAIESDKRKGWAWDELSKIDAGAGGASRAEVDAFRLLAVFLAHWDNKPENQRLICRGAKAQDDNCRQPLAMVQDVGATFGPDKLNVNRWRAFPVWADRASCRVSMHTLPYGGSSFPDVRISEEGRAFLASRLGKLSRAQVRALFAAARIDMFASKDAASRDVERWVDAFMQKVDAIVGRPPCPAS
jgi:hypothetical protein